MRLKLLPFLLLLAPLASAQTQIGGGGGGSTTPNTPVTIASAQGPRFNVMNYGAIGDAKKSWKVTVTNGSANITDTLNTPWVSGDAGKKMFCVGTGGLSALTVTIATISSFTSSSAVTLNTTGNGNATGAATNVCVWFTQKETTAFQAANTAAIGTLSGQNAFKEVASPGSMFCPEGGYVLDKPIFVQPNTGVIGNGASFIGAGKHDCRIYMSPDTTADATGGYIISTISSQNQVSSGFSVDCSASPFNIGAPGAFFNQALNLHVFDVAIDNCGSGGADTQGTFSINASISVAVDGLSMNGGGFGSVEPAMAIINSGLVQVKNFNTTNPGAIPLKISGSGTLSGGPFAGGPRSDVQAGVLIENSVLDEGGTTCAAVITNSSVTFQGVGMFAGTTCSMSADTSSSVFLNNSILASFGGTCSGGNRNAMTLTGSAYVVSAGSDYENCGTGQAVNGPSTATWVDMGGNRLRACPGGPPCPLVTAADYATHGFAGGIVPKSTQTHTPNTCYAVTGNLLATAQNLCTFLNDQNYQVLNITAQSGGTTPANSACATPPVITLSDGTRTATLTMTTGKTQWSSAVDASTVNSIFATGTTLTISIGANTCATPPVNVAVSYILQSVLNP